MLRVTVGNNLKRNVVLIDENTTLKACLEEAQIDLSRGIIHLDSAPVEAGGLNKTFAELGYDGTPGKDKAFLLSVTKADNAHN